MIIETLVVGMFQSNCYIVGDEASREAMVVDPGDEAARILSVVQRLSLQVKLIAVTHSHVDHVGALQDIRDASGASVAMHQEAAFRSSQADAGLTRLLLGVSAPPFAEPDIYVNDGDKLRVGEMELEVRFCPGHAFGHICLYGQGVVFTGDALFAGGIGRFDLPGGDGKLLLKSIRDKLLTLPDDTAVFAGHGSSSSIGEEKRSNLFLLHPRMYMGIDLD